MPGSEGPLTYGHGGISAAPRDFNTGTRFLQSYPKDYILFVIVFIKSEKYVIITCHNPHISTGPMTIN